MLFQAILTHIPLHSGRYVAPTEPRRGSQSYFRTIGVALGMSNQIWGGEPVQDPLLGMSLGPKGNDWRCERNLHLKCTVLRCATKVLLVRTVKVNKLYIDAINL